MGEVQVHALREATIDILVGELLVIVGPSGSGKTTLLNLIGGMDRATSGEVIFDGKDLAGASEKELTLYRRNQVGFIFQFFNLIPTLTALENVQVGVEILEDALEPMEALRQVGLENRADHFPAQLSGGEQQRVSIARALAGNPGLVLCDEPTGSLDLETSRQILGTLIELKNQLKKTVVLITHNNAISGIADRVARIRDGWIEEILLNASPAPVEQITW